MTLSIKLIRNMILVALVLIIFSNIALWVADFLPKIWGAIWGILTAVIAFYCRLRATGEVKANRAYYFWLAVPCILILIPLVIKLKKVFFGEEPSWWVRLWQMMPIIVNFILPVVLLWLAYSALESYLLKPAKQIP